MEHISNPSIACRTNAFPRACKSIDASIVVYSTSPSNQTDPIATLTTRGELLKIPAFRHRTFSPGPPAGVPLCF